MYAPQRYAQIIVSLTGEPSDKLLGNSTVYFLCNMSIFNLLMFNFGFKDRILVLIVPVPGHCLPLFICTVDMSPSNTQGTKCLISNQQ